MDNAIKFSNPDSKVTIGVKPIEKDIKISITDHGPGISTENLETIFKKFYTASSNLTHKDQGAGMGLAISKAIVTAHKGSIRVKSEKGLSSTFIITLPKG